MACRINRTTSILPHDLRSSPSDWSATLSQKKFLSSYRSLESCICSNPLFRKAVISQTTT
jgi:hypothetical protein